MRSLKNMLLIGLFTMTLGISSVASLQVRADESIVQLAPNAKSYPTGNYTPGEPMMRRDFYLYGVEWNDLEKYDYNCVALLEDWYGTDAWQVAFNLQENQDLYGDWSGELITFRNIVATKSIKADVIAAYGTGDEAVFDSSDFVYETMVNKTQNGEADYTHTLEYLDQNAKTKISYTYKDAFVLTFILDSNELVQGWYYAVRSN